MGLNIIEAAKALKEGKKVRRPQWIKDYFIEKGENQFIEEAGALFNCVDLLAEDWEIYEEKSDMDIAFEKAVRKEMGCFGIIQQDSFNKGWKAHEDHIKAENFQNEEKPSGESISINLWHEEIKNAINFLKGMLVSARYYDAAASLREIEKRVEDHIKEQSE